MNLICVIFGHNFKMPTMSFSLLGTNVVILCSRCKSEQRGVPKNRLFSNIYSTGEKNEKE